MLLDIGLSLQPHETLNFLKKKFSVIFSLQSITFQSLICHCPNLVSSPLSERIGSQHFFTTTTFYSLKIKSTRVSGQHSFGNVFMEAKGHTANLRHNDFFYDGFLCEVMGFWCFANFHLLFFGSIEKHLILNSKSCIYECYFSNRKLHYTTKRLFTWLMTEC